MQTYLITGYRNAHQAFEALNNRGQFQHVNGENLPW